MRILLIEDDDSVRSAVRRALLLDGFEVLPAPTGQEGLLKAETAAPDAVGEGPPLSWRGPRRRSS